MRNKQENVLGVHIGRRLSVRSAVVRRCAKRRVHPCSWIRLLFTTLNALHTLFIYVFTYCLPFRWESIQHQQHGAASGNGGGKEELCFLNTDVMLFSGVSHCIRTVKLSAKWWQGWLVPRLWHKGFFHSRQPACSNWNSEAFRSFWAAVALTLTAGNSTLLLLGSSRPVKGNVQCGFCWLLISFLRNKELL